MQVGKYKISYIETGSFALDGGAMFGVVPRPLWEKTNPPDEINRITLGARLLLLESANRKILVDTGLGGDWNDKFRRIYRVNQLQEPLLSSLSKKNITSEEITDVILTHLHFDHTGGSTKLVDGKWLPTFPNAKYYVQEKQFEWARNPSERDRASFFNERFLPLYEHNQLELLNGKYNLDDEIELIVVNGHTFSQQLVKVADSSNTLLYCADLFPTSSHIPIPYVMAYDLQPLITIEEKKDILKSAIKENWILFFEHDPFSAAATVTQTDKGYSVKEKFEQLV
ncbi:MBL fold metallo-hydrolase [Melioribacteraceae bacterium 4301-Me]|uniref:MBL fold metallo-hydrolase n=1 Tax=Pyranulibacter aquaticus TaxID=3163344 RepID=UPI0035984C0C